MSVKAFPRGLFKPRRSGSEQVLPVAPEDWDAESVFVRVLDPVEEFVTLRSRDDEGRTNDRQRARELAHAGFGSRGRP